MQTRVDFSKHISIAAVKHHVPMRFFSSHFNPRIKSLIRPAAIFLNAAIIIIIIIIIISAAVAVRPYAGQTENATGKEEEEEKIVL